MTHPAYALARVRVDGPTQVVLSQGRNAVAWDPGVDVYVVTAHNPGNLELDAAENAERQRRLEADVRALAATSYPALGGALDDDGEPIGHVEASIAVIDITREQAIGLGRRYEQDEIFVWSDGVLSRLTCRS